MLTNAAFHFSFQNSFFFFRLKFPDIFSDHIAWLKVKYIILNSQFDTLNTTQKVVCTSKSEILVKFHSSQYYCRNYWNYLTILPNHLQCRKLNELIINAYNNSNTY